VTNHDAVMRDLVILAAQHHRLFKSYTSLANELRKCRSCCASVSAIERGVSGTIESTNKIREGKALSLPLEDIPW